MLWAVLRSGVFIVALGVTGVASASSACGWAAAVRASQYADLQLTAAELVQGLPISEPGFFVERRLKEIGVDLKTLVGYRDGELVRKSKDTQAVFGTLCLLRFKDPASGEMLSRYDCPDDSKLVNLQAACDGFSACQTIACVPRSQ